MYAAVGLLATGLVVAALTLVTVEKSPQFSLAASVPGGVALLLCATWLCLLAAAAQLWRGTGSRRAAMLLGLAGLSWLVPEWENPDAMLALYASALLLASATPALVFHAAVSLRDSELSGTWRRISVLSGYVVFVGLLGIAPALMLDPAAMGCTGCPANPWLIADGGALLPLVERLGAAASATWLCLTAALLTRGVAAAAGQSKDAAMTLSAVGFLVVVAGWEFADFGWGVPQRSPLAQLFWLTASLALAAMAVSALWLLLARHRARRSLGAILVDLARGQQPGLLRAAFAERLGDPTLELLYRRADGSLVDALGRPFGPTAMDGRRYTRLAYGPSELGLIVHSSTTSVSRAELEELVATTHLGLEHEGLSARALSDERELRESGLRLLAARDAERRRLERDLHDGAQQRLVGIALGLQLLNEASPSPQMDAAQRHLTLAIGELRAMAQGLSPPVLVDAGLGPALRSLAETRDLRVTAADLRRFDPAVEATVYQLVEAATRAASAGVILESQHDTLRVRLVVDGASPAPTTAADRVVTIGGRIAVKGDGDTTVVDVTLPVHVTRSTEPEPA